MYTPIAAEFSKVPGQPVTLKTKASFEAFTDEIEKETYDIAFVQPFDYVRAHDKHGYIPLARGGEPTDQDGAAPGQYRSALGRQTTVLQGTRLPSPAVADR